MRKNRKIHSLAVSAVIAAAYAALTYLAAAMNLAYGAGSVQFRFSEALTILPALTPAAVPGLTLGCFLANLGSPLGVADWVFGSLATLVGALGTRALRKITFKNVPILSPLPPVIANSLIVGLELACLSDSGGLGIGNFTIHAYLAAALSVGLPELIVCYSLGIPLFLALRRAAKKGKLEI